MPHLAEVPVRHVPQHERDQVSLIGTLGDDRVWTRFTFGNGVYEHSIGGLVTPMFAGSGYPAGYRALRDTAVQPNAVLQALVVAGHLVDQERSTAAPTDDAFGGAFEIVWSETKPGGGGTRLAKLAGFTSVYGSIDVVGDRLKGRIDVVTQNLYRDEVALHVAVHPAPSGTTWSKFQIPSPLGLPMGTAWEDETLNDFVLQPDLLGSFFCIVEHGKVVGHVAHCETRADRNLTMLQIGGTVGGELTLEWGEAYWQGILERAQSVLDARRKTTTP